MGQVRLEAREWIVPGYVFACLMIGGSPQGTGFTLALQTAGIALLAWSALRPPHSAASPASRGLWLLILLCVSVIAAQFIPLPPSVWGSFPGREIVSAGDQLLGTSGNWRPITLSTDSSIAAALALIPPLAVVTAMIRSKAYRPDLLFGAILAAAILSIFLGLMQRGDVNGEWNLYPRGNFGVATGTFANANLFGTFLLTAIPIAVAFGISKTQSSAKLNKKGGTAVIVGPVLLFIFIGMALNRSLAVGLLTIPVIALTLLLVFVPGQVRIGRMIGLAIPLVVVGAVTAAAFGNFAGGITGSASIQERIEILEGSLRVAGHYFPLGSGLGTFPMVYPMENAQSISRFIVNHAHNDYLEVVIELGLAGILVTLAFLVWWTVTAARIWTSPDADVHARAGTLISAILLLHSLVDYPLRTSALAAIFAVAIGLMVVEANTAERNSQKPRHIRLD